MSQRSRYLLYSRAPAVGKSTLRDLLRQSMLDGAAVDSSIVAGMITVTNHLVMSPVITCNNCSACFIPSNYFVLVGWLLSVVVLDLASNHHFKHFNANFAQ